MMTTSKIISMMPPPAIPIEVPVDKDWTTVENKLGVSLPLDYKIFIEKYGSGRIGKFLSIFNAFSANENLNLAMQVENQLKVYSELKANGEILPYKLFPDAGGILPFAITDNGDVLFWQTIGKPSEWTILVNESRSPDWQEFEMSLETFLFELLSRKLRTNIFPQNFLNSPLTFDPSSYE